MNKIKIERWKEVVRLECKEDIFGSLDIEYLGRFVINDNIIVYIDESDEKRLKTNIEKYNNSIKDDGYKSVCHVCGENECKTKAAVSEKWKHKCIYDFDGDWQPINNNKIEIVEDKGLDVVPDKVSACSNFLKYLDTLNDEGRLEIFYDLFRNYCRYCGSKNLPCYCNRDD